MREYPRCPGADRTAAQQSGQAFRTKTFNDSGEEPALRHWMARDVMASSYGQRYVHCSRDGKAGRVEFAGTKGLVDSRQGKHRTVMRPHPKWAKGKPQYIEPPEQ